VEEQEEEKKQGEQKEQDDVEGHQMTGQRKKSDLRVRSEDTCWVLPQSHFQGCLL